MKWTDLHGWLLGRAFKEVLGHPDAGAMAFVRCLTPEAVDALASDDAFAPQGWRVWRVADAADASKRSIKADEAVEMRESKGAATLLLVDTDRAGAGMDGIYSASREVTETGLFRKAHRLAGGEITRRHSAADRRYAEQAVKKARRTYGGAYAVSQWAVFDFLCRVAFAGSPGAHLHVLGLWPVQDSEESNPKDNLNTSHLFVDHLLGITSANVSPTARIESLRLAKTPEHRSDDLEGFLYSVQTKPLLTALNKIAEKQHLWIGALRTEEPAQSIRSIALTSWRNRNGTIAKWSGLTESGESYEPPALILRPDADRSGRHSTLQIRWKADPANLEKNGVEYRVAVLTDRDEPLCEATVRHSARKGGEKHRFSDDDFFLANEDSRLPAKIIVSVVGNDAIEAQESEEFIIRFGEPPEQETGGVGLKVRTFSEGLAELGSRETVSEVAAAAAPTADSKGFLLLRTPIHQGARKSFRVFRPPLIAEVEQQWIERQGEIGRWIVKVRGSGERVGAAEFMPFDSDDSAELERAATASRRIAARFKSGGGVGQIYDDAARSFSTVREYLIAWAALLETGDPAFAIANTVEVQSLSARTIGLIVLPAHPLRMAWLAAYDNLVLHTALEHAQKPKDIRSEFASLDGAMFPGFLPHPYSGAFVFADTLGFHAIGMVPDDDKEPKAAVAILARALGDSASTDTAPTVGSQSAKVLGNEIVKYLECHDTSRLLHIHALRAGDGLTVARSLGSVHKRYWPDGEDDDGEEMQAKGPVFSLELYPSEAQRGIAGRFIAEAREKRRSGAGVLAAEDRWMLESLSLPGGISRPRLRWARKEEQDPKTAAHLALAFDTFESRVTAESELPQQASRPHHAFGLLSFYERRFTSSPSPLWISATPPATAGEKHPSRRAHTEILARLQNAVQSAVARHIGADPGRAVLKTEISRDKADSLENLHRLCDWVITLDRNAGIEYFDSPLDNPDIYDAYVIDCVPEREDLGCLQLITSTANLDEVRNLLDRALDQMGLSRSRRNAEFLMGHLKALSGRLAIRLTGHRPATSELIALAVSHAHCRDAPPNTECWVSLKDGFIVPVDDVCNLLPPLLGEEKDEKRTRPDLIHVTTAPRKGLVFRFIEVKYRRHLRAARSPDILKRIDEQTRGLRKRWERWYDHEECTAFRTIRRAKLARVLRFYADKAHRHYLPEQRHAELVSEIERMVEKGGDYAFATVAGGDRGWIFCPEYAGHEPLKISPDDWNTQIFLFGPHALPDTDLAPGTVTRSPRETATRKQPVRSSKPAAGNISAGGDTPTAGDTASASETAVASDTSPRSTGTSVSAGDTASSDETAPRSTDDHDPSVDDSGDCTGNADSTPAICFGTDSFTDAEIHWPVAIKGNPHLLIAGLPGMGKTTCLLNLCKQMVAADIRPIVFSYHQDIDERLEQTIDSVRFIDFDGLGFNPLQVIDRESRLPHLDVAGAMRDIFTAIYPELGDIQADSIRRAVKESFVETGWEADVVPSDAAEPAFRRFFEILRDKPKPDRTLRSLLARLEELDDYGFFRLRESHSSLWESGHPTVIRIHTTQNDNLQRAFASLVFYGLYKDMFRRGIQDRITHALIFDEAHRAARLNLIPKMAKECRKYGISLVLASQEARDFNVSVFSAIANYLILRLTDADAKFLVRNVSNSRQERMLIDRIKLMEKFKALYFREGKSRPYPVDLAP